MKKRLRAFTLGLMVLLALAAACGGESATPTIAPTATRPPTATPSGIPTATLSTGDAVVQRGKTLAAQCNACHSIDGSSRVGPTWKGLFGATVVLTSGASTTADELYLKESIENPNAKVVQGFSANLMPATYGATLSDDDIAALIEYIKTLR